MSQINRDADRRQSQAESSLGGLGILRAILEHDELRIRQAIRRTGERRLLEPVLEDFVRARQEIAQIQDALSGEWRSGQESGWSGNSPK